ncbi:DUF1036 domain-containing protein [Parvibaculum sp.]|uniref:DUF1036 domain-containing protein n=3 Tax=Parvibaculum sp. TaxID=2024848 RepID=UPI001B23C7F1|nr:DUF1036 domain-containing protein [Parvibaculum sp.]MBO6677943.1 DUF1036 domain-containing protein [Parvibaculum sp.]MBO6906394.1 DUF1036 domain-containing protein [Parvibaculum sp.]
MKYSLQIAAAALLCCLVLPADAHAEYRFCNKTSYVLDGAIAFEADGAWKSRGWTRIPPGDCTDVLEGSIEERDYFVFARSIDAHKGSIKYFSGNTGFCIVDDAFEIEGRDQCAMRGYDSADFLRVRTTAGENWTTTFAEAGEYTEDEARIAGAQRLLKDIGFALKQIDGIAARNTLRAVEAFQRSEKEPATGRIDDVLVGQLIARAIEERDRVGLTFCNRTGELVWAAVGYRNGEGDMSSGWIRIEPSGCRKAIKGELTEEAYYVYAEAVDDTGTIVRRQGSALVWGGNDNFCTKATRFQIRGRERCVARGFDERGFMRVETGGETFRRIDFD